MSTLLANYGTIGLNATHANLKTPKMVRVQFDVYGDDDVRVYAISGNNLSRMPKIGGTTITREELSELPDDPYNDAVFAMAAFELLGLRYN